MTLIVATITPTRGWISADSLIEWQGPPTAETRAAIEGCYRLAGREGMPEIDPDSPVGRKVQILPRQKFAFVLSTYAGMVAFLFGAAAQDAPDIDAAVVAFRDAWRQHVPVTAKHIVGGGLIAVGWSPKAARVVAYEAQIAHGLEPRLVERDTIWTPEPPKDAPEAEDIRRLVDRARDGDGVPELHEAVFHAVAWGAQHGLYRGHRVGGKLTTAAVDESGVTVHDGLDLGLPERRPFDFGASAANMGAILSDAVRADAEFQRRRADRQRD